MQEELLQFYFFWLMSAGPLALLFNSDCGVLQTELTVQRKICCQTCATMTNRAQGVVKFVVHFIFKESIPANPQRQQEIAACLPSSEPPSRHMRSRTTLVNTNRTGLLFGVLKEQRSFSQLCGTYNTFKVCSREPRVEFTCRATGTQHQNHCTP